MFRLRAPAESAQPLLAVEAAVLLNRAVDVLDDRGAVHGESAGAVRKRIDSLAEAGADTELTIVFVRQLRGSPSSRTHADSIA